MQLNRRKKVNFAVSYKKYDQTQKSLSNFTVIITFAVVILLIMGVYYITSLINEKNSLESQLTNVESYINDSNNIQKVQEVTEKETQIQSMTTASSDLDSVAYVASLFPKYNSDFIDALNYTGVTITNVEYTVAKVTINAESSSYTTPGDYITYLKNTGLFYQVNYSGFTKSDAEDGSSVYQFVAEGIVLRGGNNE